MAADADPNPKAAAGDTNPKAAAVQLQLLRNATAGARGRALRSLSSTVIELSRRALRESMPGADDDEVMLRWIALHYGEGLAERVARRLSR
jgi:hypothetical protein